MKPLGFALSDINTIMERVKCTLLKSYYEYRYIPKNVRKDTTFLILGKEFRKFNNVKLLGRFLVIDSIDNLQKIEAELIDCEIKGNAIKPIQNWKLKPCDSIKTKFQCSFTKRDFIDKLIQTRKEEHKVFKHTLQFLMSLYEDECKKRNLKPNKVEIVKVLSGALETYSNEKLKKINSMFDSWKETIGGKRTLQAYHDICLNKTEFHQAVYDNCADPFSLKILLDIWKGTNFKFFEGNLISKRVMRLRSKKPIVKPTLKTVLV